MPRMQTTSIEELIMRSARSYLYGHPFAWEEPADRYRAGRARTPGRRRGLSRLTFSRGRGAPAPARDAARARCRPSPSR